MNTSTRHDIKFRAYIVNSQGNWMAQQGTHPEVATPARFLAMYGDQIVMQYTGLRDKTGREIYEGDIIRYLYGGSTGEVVYKRGCFKLIHHWETLINGMHKHMALESYALSWAVDNYDGVEVIGNIYENPELISTNQLTK